MNCIFREREGGEPPNVQQRVARSEDHHLPLGERRPRRKDRHQPLAEDSVLNKPPFWEALFIAQSINYQYNKPNIHNGMRFR